MSDTLTETPVVVCWSNDFLIRRILHCPVCEQRRRFVVHDGAWYGATFTCCGCGDRFAEEGRMPRPFKPGWRREAIAKARRDWDSAGPYDRDAHTRWLKEQFGEPTEAIAAGGGS